VELSWPTFDHHLRLSVDPPTVLQLCKILSPLRDTLLRLYPIPLPSRRPRILAYLPQASFPQTLFPLVPTSPLASPSSILGSSFPNIRYNPMDLYTTSFLLPLALNGPLPSSTSPSSASEQAEQQHLDDLKRLALEVGTREGCLVTVSYVDSNGSSPNAKRVNVCVSGSYGQVMRARGAVLRDFPRRVSLVIPSLSLFQDDRRAVGASRHVPTRGS
jgi:hypothetical protein